MQKNEAMHVLSQLRDDHNACHMHAVKEDDETLSTRKHLVEMFCTQLYVYICFALVSSQGA